MIDNTIHNEIIGIMIILSLESGTDMNDARIKEALHDVPNTMELCKSILTKHYGCKEKVEPKYPIKLSEIMTTYRYLTDNYQNISEEDKIKSLGYLIDNLKDLDYLLRNDHLDNYTI